MEEEVQFCKNCKRNISSKNFVIHSAHCERNIQLCDRCSEPVLRSELKEHEEEFHFQETCSDCGISVEKWQIERHKETCPKKLTPCNYCELEVPLENLSEHEDVCGSRTEYCPKCKKHVMKKDLENHPFKCLIRPEELSCQYCNQQTNLSEYEEHIAMCGTRTERCSLCNQHVMVSERDVHFASCRKALNGTEHIVCEYCNVSLSPNDMIGHVEFCKLQTEKCDRCNDYIQRGNKALHHRICEQKQQLRLYYPCEYCGNLFLPEDLEQHLAICGNQTKKCEKCQKFIEFKNLKTHPNLCKEPKIHGTCPVCHQLIPWIEMNIHTTVCARMNSETYEYECQNQFNEYALKKEHEASTDENTEELKPDPVQNTKRCPFCFEEFPFLCFNQHLQVCLERPYDCKNCLKSMAYKNKELHVTNCRGQQTERHYENDSAVYNEKTVNNAKLKKLKRCQFCNVKFLDVLFQHHIEECNHRVEKCILCAENVPIKDMKEHKLLKCNFHNNMLSEAVPEPFKNVESERRLEENVEICPSCTCKIPVERYNEHLPLGFEERTRCHFCRISIFKTTEREHILSCRKILEMVQEEKNSQSKAKGRGRKEVSFQEKSSPRTFLENISSLFSPKGKSFTKSNTSEPVGEYRSLLLNRSQNYEKGIVTPVQQPSTIYNEVPCEFCNELWPFELLIEHQSGCRPDLVSFPKTNEECEGKLFSAAATSYTPILGASAINIQEDNEWKEVSKRNKPGSSRENTDYRIKERNGSQKPQLRAREKFFFYPSQDSDELPKKLSGSSNKKRYSQHKTSPEISKKKYTQQRESPEISKKQSSLTKDIKEVPNTKSDSTEDRFTSFKFSTSVCNEKMQNDSHFLKKNDSEASNTEIHEEIKKISTCSLLDCVKPKFPYGDKAIGAERTERKKMMLARGDSDADLSLVNKEFKEITFLKSITFDENIEKNEACNVMETAKCSKLNQNLPIIWNTEYKYDIKGKGDTKSFSDNIENKMLNPDIQDADYDEKNEETFGSDLMEWNTEYKYDIKGNSNTQSCSDNIDTEMLNPGIQDADYDEKIDETFKTDLVESIKKSLNKEEESDTHSNSDDMFYDADDGGDKLVDIVNENIYRSSNTLEEKASLYNLDSLILTGKNKRESLSHNNNNRDLNVGFSLGEEDLSSKDNDLNAYYQYLFESTETVKGVPFNKTNASCKCNGKECCCAASIMKMTSAPKACSHEDVSAAANYSEPKNMEPFAAETKTSTRLKSKNSLLEASSKKKTEFGNFSSDEVFKWNKWRTKQASDSE